MGKGNYGFMTKYLRQLIAIVPIVVALVIPAAAAEQKAVFAGGCFWGVEAVFEHVRGVIDVRSGYAGGTKGTADYESVSSATTKHAEAVEIRFDPARVTYEQLLYVFFTVAHDPTEVNRQGPDVGPQYRSAIFYTDDKQKKAASGFILALESSKALHQQVATEVVPLVEFFVAERYHQDFLRNNPTDPYIVAHDLPKLQALKEKFSELYKK
ncbi:MAG: peptide-methionine (S)-S-oxide reductase MsrA [Acidobacteriota bacterium]